MSGCCGKRDENDGKGIPNREIPEGFEPCCKTGGQRCFCLPYNDGWLIASQILSIPAAVCSGVWFASLAIGMVGMISIQMLWCFRRSRGMVYASVWIALVSSVASFGAGIFALTNAFPDQTTQNCTIFGLMLFERDETAFQDGESNEHEHDRLLAGHDDFQPWRPFADYDYCNETQWAVIAFLSGALWVASAVCLLWFVWSGRHAEWEEWHRSRETGDNHITTNENPIEKKKNSDVIITSIRIVKESAPKPPGSERRERAFIVSGTGAPTSQRKTTIGEMDDSSRRNGSMILVMMDDSDEEDDAIISTTNSFDSKC